MDSKPARLAIGILAASEIKLGALRERLMGSDYGCTEALFVDDLLGQADDPLQQLLRADVWIAHLDMSALDTQTILDVLESSHLPVIYWDDERPETSSDLTESQINIQIERRIASKIRHLVSKIDKDERARAKLVWILAASTGGPNAVALFLADLPPRLDGVALFYAQHIDTSAMESLIKVVRRHCQWSVEFIDKATVIRENTIYLVPPQHQIEFLEAGIVSPLQEAWAGRYRPSIDQLIARVARVYPKKCGVIVFTGMGDDGAQGCTLLHHRGGQVWVQSADSCTIDAMPQAVMQKGCVQYSGTPGDLAQQFIRYHKYGKHPQVSHK